MVIVIVMLLYLLIWHLHEVTETESSINSWSGIISVIIVLNYASHPWNWLSYMVDLMSQYLEAMRVWGCRNKLRLTFSKTEWLCVFKPPNTEDLLSLALIGHLLSHLGLVNNQGPSWRQQVRSTDRRAFAQIHLVYYCIFSELEGPSHSCSWLSHLIVGLLQCILYGAALEIYSEATFCIECSGTISDRSITTCWGNAQALWMHWFQLASRYKSKKYLPHFKTY